MSKKIKIFGIVGLIIALIVAGVSFFGGTTEPEPSTGLTTTAGIAGGPAVPVTGAQNSAAANEFSSLLSSVKSITIDTAVFQNPAYRALRDYPVVLGTDIMGRANPFAPVGSDGSNAAQNSGTQVQTLTPGKVATTSAELGALVTLPDTISSTVVFQYGLSDSFGSTTNPITVTKSGTTLSTITGLTPGTEYFVQAAVVRGSGTIVGNIMTFTTLGGAAVTQ